VEYIGKSLESIGKSLESTGKPRAVTQNNSFKLTGQVNSKLINRKIGNNKLTNQEDVNNELTNRKVVDNYSCKTKDSQVVSRVCFLKSHLNVSKSERLS